VERGGLNPDNGAARRDAGHDPKNGQRYIFTLLFGGVKH
jgi:hypothetical protein